MTKESQLLIGALGWAVTGKTEELSLSVDWEALLKLAKEHMLLPLLGDGLQKAGCWEKVPQKAAKVLEKATMQAVYHDAQTEHIRSKLEKGLKEEKIPYVFLKGSVLTITRSRLCGPCAIWMFWSIRNTIPQSKRLPGICKAQPVTVTATTAITGFQVG